MTQHIDSLHDLLAADAARRAAPHDPAEGAVAEPHGSFADLRFRLVNSFPRETRAVLATLRAELAPFGYALSPLHPAPDLSVPRMLAELTRADGGAFAPLVFELERETGEVRVFVRQFGGRAASDFAERRLDVSGPADAAAVDAILRDYVACMLRPLQDRAA